VEEYDSAKNIWIQLPDLNMKHSQDGCLKVLHNEYGINSGYGVLACVGKNHCNDVGLGYIEFLDPRARCKVCLEFVP
jgi:hypothetical protein